MRKWMLCVLILFIASSALFAGEAVESKFKVNLYGFIKFESIYDNTEIAQGDWLLFARPGNSDYADQSIFTMNARHSRLGLKIDGPAFCDDGVVKGLIEVDFAGGFPNSSTAARQPQLRLRHAWVELNKPGWELRMGQDWALISGPFPNTTSFVVGAGKGHLWMRYPQIKYTRKLGDVKIAVSMNRPMAGNIKYEDYAGGDFDPVGDGERSGMPWLMGRFWWQAGPANISVSGHYGQEQIDDLSAAHHDMTTYSVNANVQVKSGPLQLDARVFTGENLNSFFGGVFQGFVRNETSITNIASQGGWGQAVCSINENWSLTVGGGMDDPQDDDLTSGMRSLNTWIFGNVGYSLNKSVLFMLETDYLQTEYLNGEAGENIRLQFVSYLKF